MSSGVLDMAPIGAYNCVMHHPTYRQRREAIGLSLREVARRTEVNPGRLSIIERGVEPSAEEKEVIESVLFRAELAFAREVKHEPIPTTEA